MKLRRSHLRLVALAASCIALGAGISAIATAGATTSKAAGKAGSARAFGLKGKVAKILKRTAEGQLVVQTKTGWATVTFERGTVVSVSGQQLTLNEGTKTATYKTVTLTIPANARVRVNHQLATLSQLTAGQRATVLTLPKRTLVIAHTPKTK
jgi:hypothetical protein